MTDNEKLYMTIDRLRKSIASSFFCDVAGGLSAACTKTINQPSRQEGKTFDYEDLKRVMDSIPKCPIKEMMEKQGKSPDDGWVIVFHDRFKSKMPIPPIYVRFSCVVPPNEVYFLDTKEFQLFGGPPTCVR